MYIHLNAHDLNFVCKLCVSRSTVQVVDYCVVRFDCDLKSDVMIIILIRCRHNVLPIVMGARPDDYAAVLPPHSYIHVDDFRSARELAAYLRVLDANDTLYNEYFRWKSEWVSIETSYWCRLCGLLHVAAEQRYVHWYSDYSEWWNGEHSSACGSRWNKRGGVWWRTWL